MRSFFKPTPKQVSPTVPTPPLVQPHASSGGRLSLAPESQHSPSSSIARSPSPRLSVESPIIAPQHSPSPRSPSPGFPVESLIIAPRDSICPGVRLTFPPGENQHTSYPFGLHAEFSLPWNYFSEGEHFLIVVANGFPVRNLVYANHAMNWTDAMISLTNTPLMFFPFGGLIRRVRKKNDQLRAMRLTKLNDARILAGKIAELDLHKQLMMAIATSDERRISQLIRVGLKNGESISAMLDRFYRACVDVHREGPKYNPKGFTPDDYMVGLCVLRLGGARLADLLHRALGLPGLTTLRAHSIIQPLRASPAMPTIQEIEANIDAYTAGEAIPTGPPRIVHRVLMLDEIAVEKRARWDNKTNMILGACREHSEKAGLQFCHLDDATTFFQQLNTNQLHLASEPSVATPRMYNPRPICISGTCKAEKGRQHANLLRKLLEAIQSRKVHGNITYRDISVGSDGEATRGLALALEFMKHSLAPSSPIYPLLKPLQFMNLQVGPDDITPDKDYRHVIKALRSLLMRRMGTNLLGFEIVPAVIKQHLRDVGLTEERIHALLNPNDRQDVDLTYSLLKEIWTLPDAPPNASPPMPFFCVAKAKIDIPDSEFFLILLGTDRLEKLFGLIRTAVGTDSNFDILQFASRASNLTEVNIILGLKPHWDRGPRRLKLPAVINERGDVSSKADHVSPASWIGDLRVADVVPHTCWLAGRLKAEEIVATAREQLQKCARIPGFDILSPFGELLVGRADLDSAFEVDPELLSQAASKSTDVADIALPKVGPAADPESMELPADDNVEDFEDTLAIHESPTCKHSPHVLVDGKQVSKASILKDLMQHRSPRLSTDRTKRVAGIPAFANEAVPHHIAFDNPTVGQVNTIILGSRPMESIVLELFPDRGTKISYQIFHLAPVNSGDEPGDKYDWKWSLGFESRTIHNVPGHLVHPLNPTVSNQVPGKPTYLFSSDVLITVAANIDGYLAHYNAIPEIGQSETFPYRCKGKACFHIASPTLEGNGRGEFGPRSPQSPFECTKCYPSVPIQKTNYQRVLEHNGAHILFDESLKPADQPCGLCLRPFPICTFVFQKRSDTAAARQIDWKSSTCLNPLNFQMSAAMKSSEKSPCSNYLIECPLQCGVVLWTYNLTAHYNSYHALKSLSNIPAVYQMAELERERMKVVWNNRQVYPSVRRMKKQKMKPQLWISDAHRSTMAWRQLEEEDPTPVEGDGFLQENLDNVPRAPGHRAHRQIVQDSDSDSYSTYDDSIDVRKIKQEADDALEVWDDVDSDGSLEYFDEESVSRLGLQALENHNVDREMNLMHPQIEPYRSVPASPTPELRPLEDDDVDREIMRVTAPQIEHNLSVYTSPTSPAPSPISNSPDAVAVNSPATSTPELSALRSRTKRKAAEVECICGNEVTNDQRESDAVKCIRAGCETIWTAQLQRSGVGTGFATRESVKWWQHTGLSKSDRYLPVVWESSDHVLKWEYPFLGGGGEGSRISLKKKLRGVV
ncbi:hypothetical protein B0H14DRAFT_3158054 [Mycena olivaceomarginata]|nr:hypothetical protein B0H14DRAFT_3158054 [Mycena olivaceomarginata]